MNYNQAQSSQDPKRCVCSTKVVLQPSTIQPGNQRRHFQLKFYYNQAQSSQDPKRCISSIKVLVLVQAQISQDPNGGISSTQKLNYNQAKSSQDLSLKRAFPILKLYYNQAQSSQDTKRCISSTRVCTATNHNPARTVGLKSCKWGPENGPRVWTTKRHLGRVSVPDPGSCYEACSRGCYGNRWFLLRSGPPFLLQVPVMDSLFTLRQSLMLLVW